MAPFGAPLVPPFVESRQEATSRLGAQRADKWRQRLNALAAGLVASSGADNFGQGLARGFGGAVIGGQVYQTQEEKRQQDRAEAEQQQAQREWERRMGEQRFGLDTQRVGYEGQRLALEGRRIAAEEARLNQPGATDTNNIRDYNFLTTHGVKPESAVERIFPSPVSKDKNDKLVQVQGPNGLPILVPESQAAGMQPVRERSLIKGQERTTLAFYNRAKTAEDTIAGLEGKIASMPVASQFQLRYAPNIFQTDEQQVYRQAQRAFTEARLRKESGAAIPNSEYLNDARTYFAQPGDSPETLRKKREARQVVLNGLKFASGAAYEEYYGEPNTPPGKSNTVEALGAKYGF